VEITVRGKQFDVPEHVEERARRKLERLARYLPILGDAAVEVDLTQEKAKEPDRRYVVRVTVSGRGVHLQAEERAAQPAAAVDQAAQVLGRQARRHKERLYERGRTREAKETAGVASSLESEMGEEGSEEGSESRTPVARVKRFAIKPMTTEEAAEQMEALGHAFFLFYDAEAEQFHLLYRRRAGDYGLIIPELA
jgi:putative sigma-54 modulation protein